MLTSITVLKIALLTTATCTFLLLTAGIHGELVESILLRPAQLLTVTLSIMSVVFYLKLLGLTALAQHKSE